MHQEPTGLRADTQHATDLQGAHALLGRHEKLSCGQPFVQGDFGTLVQRPHGHSEGLAAFLGVALVEAGAGRLALHERAFAHDTTMRAYAAIFPNPGLKPLAGLGLVLKDWV